MMKCAGNELADLSEGSFDEQMAYVKNVERDFIDGIDELLESLNLSYLRVKA